MSISNFKAFECEAEVCGVVRTLTWDGHEGQLTIHGLTGMMETTEVIQQLALGRVATMGTDMIERLANTTFPPKTAAVQQTVALTTAVGPPPVKKEQVKLVPKADTAPPAAQATTPTKTEPTPAPTPAPAGPTQAEPSTRPPVAGPAMPGDLDLAPFATYTRVGEIVAAIREQLGPTCQFDQIMDRARQILARGQSVCPALHVLEQKGALEERLRVHCAAKGVVGAA
jgi:hypothetical protein